MRVEDYTLMYTLFGYYNLYRNDCYACFTDSELQQLRDDYQAWLQQDFQANLRQYRIDFALWDTQSDSAWDLNEYPFMKFITEINGVRVYRVS